MVQMWVEAPNVQFPPPNLPETDDEPLESPWHLAAIALLIELAHCWLGNRKDYFVGGNLFIYYSKTQSKKEDYKGPDFMLVKRVDGTRLRKYWAIWDEDGKYPDLLMEFLSPSTAQADRTTKKTLYEQTFKTPEYFLYDPATHQLEGWRLNVTPAYQPISPNEKGWLWSEQLGLWLGLWEGEHLGLKDTWLRFYDPQGQLVSLQRESEGQRAEEEHQIAEQQRRRADGASAELASLKAFLAEKGIAPPPSDESPR